MLTLVILFFIFFYRVSTPRTHSPRTQLLALSTCCYLNWGRQSVFNWALAGYVSVCALWERMHVCVWVLVLHAREEGEGEGAATARASKRFLASAACWKIANKMIRFVNCSAVSLCNLLTRFSLRAKWYFCKCHKTNKKKGEENKKWRKSNNKSRKCAQFSTFRRLGGGFNCWAKKTFEQTSLARYVCVRVCVTRCVSVCVCVRVDKLNNWQLFGKFYELIISHITSIFRVC